MAWFKTKSKEIPSGQTVSVQVAEKHYRVTWYSLNSLGSYSNWYDATVETKFFIDKDEAEQYRDELNKAMAFLKNSVKSEHKAILTEEI